LFLEGNKTFPSSIFQKKNNKKIMNLMMQKVTKQQRKQAQTQKTNIM